MSSRCTSVESDDCECALLLSGVSLLFQGVVKKSRVSGASSPLLGLCIWCLLRPLLLTHLSPEHVFHGNFPLFAAIAMIFNMTSPLPTDKLFISHVARSLYLSRTSINS